MHIILKELQTHFTQHFPKRRATVALVVVFINVLFGVFCHYHTIHVQCVLSAGEGEETAHQETSKCIDDVYEEKEGRGHQAMHIKGVCSY